MVEGLCLCRRPLRGPHPDRQRFRGLGKPACDPAATRRKITNQGQAMTRLQFGILGAVILAGGAACWVIEQSAQSGLAQKNESLRQEADQLARLAAENERLSNLLKQGKSPASLSEAE